MERVRTISFRMGATMGKRRRDAGLKALARSPSHLLHRVLQKALDLWALEAGDEPGPSQRQYAVLAAAAADPGLTQAALVRATGIDRSTLAEMVARMASLGHLERDRSAKDGRAKTVRVSPQGQALLAAAAPRAEAADARLLERLSNKKREAFLDALADLAADDEPEAEEPAKASEAEGDAKPGKKKLKKAKKHKRVEAVEPAA